MTRNTEHDEAYNRAHWREGETWLGLESWKAPKHGPRVDLATLRGTFGSGPRHAHVMRRSYR